MKRRDVLRYGGAAALTLAAPRAWSRSAVTRGVTDTEILLGQTNPYSGPLSAYSAWYGKVQLAYCKYINDKGGINGRKITLISYDDAYQPPRTVEQVRKLVESDHVAAIVDLFGTAPNRAVVKYLNAQGVPSLFCGVSGEGFAEPETQPWTMPFAPNARIEARIYARYIAEALPGKKIGILYQQDEIGESIRKGMREGLGDAADLLVSELAYQVSDTTVDSQILTLRNSGAEILFNSATLKHAAQAAKKAQEIGWAPQMFTLSTTSGLIKILGEAGSQLQEGTVSSVWHKNPGDPIWADDPAMQEWHAFMTKYYPEGDQSEPACVLSTCYLQAALHVLEQCGDDLSNENIMAQAANLQNVQLPLLLPGITLNTSKTDYNPVEDLQLTRVENGQWTMFGEVRTG